MYVIDGLAGMIKDGLTPVLVMNGALLAMISLRNQHLSDRARNSTEQLNVKPAQNPENTKRRRSLRRQSICFICRYILTSLSFVAMTLALMLFGSAGVSAGHTEIMPSYLADVIATWGVWVFGVGGAILIIEFVIGPVTLLMNYRTRTFK